LTPYEQYEFENNYPRATGSIRFGVASDGSHTWTNATASIHNGFGSSSLPQYIQFVGDSITNVYDTTKNLDNNLKVDFSQGFTIEFWMNKAMWADPVLETEKEVIYHLYDIEKYRRFLIYVDTSLDNKGFKVEYESGDGTDLTWITEIDQLIRVSSTDLADNNWHHYALTISTGSTGFVVEAYKDGSFVSVETYANMAPETVISGSLVGTIGSLGAKYSTGTAIGHGKIIADFDDFRVWKERRTAKDIKENYFCSVGGGNNTDFDKNNNLSLYYKFNEGITGDISKDEVILDYSGRLTNAIYEGYHEHCRQYDSAMTNEKADPIIYIENQYVVDYQDLRLTDAENYDNSNNSCILNNVPSWLIEKDEDSQALANFLHIIGSYFDVLFNQIEGITKNNHVIYSENKKNKYIKRYISIIWL
jgi:hypothetical protein